MSGLRECAPGGSCPDCNPPPIFCQECLENEIENPGDVCERCTREAAEEKAADEQTTRDLEKEA
jgi:hypothetical protein